MSHYPQNPQSPQGPSRRSILLSGLIGGVAGAAGLIHPSGIVLAADPLAPVPPLPLPGSATATRVLRFAHPTDIHVQPELNGGRGMAQALSHMMGLKDPPAMIINGGDCPMDSASVHHDRAKQLWDLFFKTFADNVPAGVPLYSALGNHDVFGRDRKKSKTDGSEAQYGKKWFTDNFKTERTYHSFDKAGWHFIILDSIDWTPKSPNANFTARITGEQLEWLKGDLKATPATTPIVVITHVPIMSVVNFFDHPDETWKPGDVTFEMESSRMHIDCRDLEALFRAHGNVKLCLSGHIHLLDKCLYNGVTYICDGAVSSNKWKGVRRQTPNGYGLIDLFSDGTFQHQYMTYGWTT